MSISIFFLRFWFTNWARRGGPPSHYFLVFLSFGRCWGQNASRRFPRTTPDLFFYGFLKVCFTDVMIFRQHRGRECRTETKKGKQSVLFFDDFGSQNHRHSTDLSLRSTGNYVVQLGTVAGRPKAIGYAAPVLALACWRDKLRV